MVRRVLIADDDEEMREMLERSLSRAGFEVLVVGDGAELRARLANAHERGEAPPDLLISDIRMPGWTGLNALDWVRRFLPETHVVLISAFCDRRTHERAHQLGALAVLDKPFDLGDLHATIASIAHEPAVRDRTSVHGELELKG